MKLLDEHETFLLFYMGTLVVVAHRFDYVYSVCAVIVAMFAVAARQ